MPTSPAPQVNAVRLAKFVPALLLACLLQLIQIQRVRAETHFDYKYEDYAEDQQRMRIKTHSAMFELDLDPRLSLKGEYVYDGISGATPTGRYNHDLGVPWDPAGGNIVDTVGVTDIRRAGSIAPTLKLGRYTLTPLFSYSKESDNESKGLALNQSLDFNEKITREAKSDRCVFCVEPIFSKIHTP